MTPYLLALRVMPSLRSTASPSAGDALMVYIRQSPNSSQREICPLQHTASMKHLRAAPDSGADTGRSAAQFLDAVSTSSSEARREADKFKAPAAER